MNPNTLLSIWTNFNVVFESTHFTDAEKAAIGRELLAMLPRTGIYVSFDATVAACRRSIEDRIATLEKPIEKDSVVGGPVVPEDQDSGRQPKATRRTRK